MSKKLLLSVFVLSGFLLFGVGKVTACSCKGGANPCGFFSGTGGVAFIGTVSNVIETNEKYGKPIQGKARKITIKVDEVFKGSLPNEIITSDDGYSCDNFPFSLGKSYLIYSKGILENTENILPIGLCSGTTVIDNAQDSINFLRQMKAGKFPSILYGKVQRTVNNERNQFEPLPGTEVILTKIYATENGQYREPKGSETKFETITDEKGEYKFENLASGRYRLSLALPDNAWMPAYREFSAGGKPFCDNHTLYVFTDGRISGNVVSSEGITVGFLKLRISPVDNITRFYHEETQTDKDGNYTFYGLSEGKYKIHVYLPWYSLDRSRTYPFSVSNFPFSFYYFPNSFDDKNAQIINLGYAEELRNINLKMPSLPVEQTIDGSVVWEDGTPAENAMISYVIKGLGIPHHRYIMTRADGSFSLQVFEGFEYEFRAENNSNEVRGYSDWVSFTKDELRKLIKLKMKPVK